MVVTWDGTLSAVDSRVPPTPRYLDAHLLHPRANAFTITRPDDVNPDYRLCAAGAPACFQDTHYASPGNRSLRSPPGARLFCYHADGTERCGSFDTAPETLRYVRTVSTGDFVFYLVDYYSGMGPTHRFLNDISATVRVITHETPPYVIRPPTTAPACGNGKYWYVFKQSALTGGVTIPVSGRGELLCTGSRIDGDLGLTSSILPGPIQEPGS